VLGLKNPLRVMISSTIEDLREERAAVDAAVTSLGLERFRSEMTGSVAMSSYELCIEMAQTCDVFVLIVGRRYGWRDPVTHLSVTELEFNEARTADSSKVIVFVQELPDSEREPEAVAFEKRVTDFRAGYFRRQKFRSPQQLEVHVRHDLGTWLSSALRQAQLPEAAVLSLPSSLQTNREWIALGLGLALLMGLPEALKAVGYLGFLAVSPSEVVRSLRVQAVPVLLDTLALSSVGLVGGVALFVAALLLASRDIRLRPTAPIRQARSLQFLAVVLVPFLLNLPWVAPLLLGLGALPAALTASLAVAVILMFTASEETAALDAAGFRAEADARSRKWLRLARAMLLGRQPVNAAAASVATVVGCSVLFGDQSGIGYLFTRGTAYFRLDEVFSAGILLVFALFGVRTLVRTLQSSFAFSRIVVPAVRSSRGAIDSA